MVHDDLLAVALFRRLIKLWVGIERKLQNAFVTTTEHGQRTVRRDVSNGLMMVEIVAEFCPFFLFAAHDCGDQMGILPQVITHFRQQCGVFGKALHQNVACAVERGFRVRHAFVAINVLCRFHVRIVGRFVPEQIGQRLKAGFNGDLSTGAAFRFIGQVEVFELGLT
ncbi:Uncharacterised protein [Salmonella enterica subsp. enterica serovar Typhi]|nr:Uncharacterised protein [Salmonella enterica subsp. enterica serovar Typhi]